MDAKDLEGDGGSGTDMEALDTVPADATDLPVTPVPAPSPGQVLIAGTLSVKDMWLGMWMENQAALVQLNNKEFVLRLREVPLLCGPMKDRTINFSQVTQWRGTDAKLQFALLLNSKSSTAIPGEKELKSREVVALKAASQEDYQAWRKEFMKPVKARVKARFGVGVMATRLNAAMMAMQPGKAKNVEEPAASGASSSQKENAATRNLSLIPE